MPEHFKKICSAIDQLPAEIDFGVPARSDCLSQGPESLGRSDILLDEDNQSHEAGEVDSPATSFSKPAPKRRKSPVKKS